MMVGSDNARTLVLIGKTGNGKSATGNSILGKNRFQSTRSFSSVTTTSQLETVVLKDGQMLNVIDTPGILDFERYDNNVDGFLKLITDSIHAVLLVISGFNRFSGEEKDIIESMQEFFGTRISDYMIVVFTGGDELEENGKTFKDFLSDCPAELKEILYICGNRYVVFDNRTKDQAKKTKQVQKLVSLVNKVLEKNGEPYTNPVFDDEEESGKAEGETEEFQASKRIKRYSEEEMFVMMEQMKKKIEMVEENAEVARKKAENDVASLRKVLVNYVAKLRQEIKEINSF